MRRVLWFAAALPILFACSDDGPTEPGAFSGAYQIESINGELPFLDDLAPLLGDSLLIIGGDLSVLSRGRVRLVFLRQWHPRNGGPPSAVMSDTLVREYRMEGDFVYIDHPTGGLQGPYTDTMQVSDNTLTLNWFVNRYHKGQFWRTVLYVRKQP
jgi:hypothetical protein